MEYLRRVWNKFKNDETLARVLILICPWPILGIIEKQILISGINIKFSNPVDWTLFVGLILAVAIVMVISTIIGDLNADKESKESSMKIRAYTYEDIAGIFSTLAGGLIFLKISDHADLSSGVMFIICFLFYLITWILLMASKNLRQNIQ